MSPSELVAIECTCHVRETVSGMREIGLTLQQAQREAARVFGLTARRVRAYWNREVSWVSGHELDGIRARRKAAIVERQRRLDDELDRLRLRLRALDGPT